MNYAIVEKSSNRAIAIVDSKLVEWFVKNLPIFDHIEIGSIGSESFNTSEGVIRTISIQPVGTFSPKDSYHMISNMPNSLSLYEAYKLIS